MSTTTTTTSSSSRAVSSPVPTPDVQDDVAIMKPVNYPENKITLPNPVVPVVPAAGEKLWGFLTYPTELDDELDPTGLYTQEKGSQLPAKLDISAANKKLGEELLDVIAKTGGYVKTRDFLRSLQVSYVREDIYIPASHLSAAKEIAHVCLYAGPNGVRNKDTLFAHVVCGSIIQTHPSQTHPCRFYAVVQMFDKVTPKVRLALCPIAGTVDKVVLVPSATNYDSNFSDIISVMWSEKYSFAIAQAWEYKMCLDAQSSKKGMTVDDYKNQELFMDESLGVKQMRCAILSSYQFLWQPKLNREASIIAFIKSSLTELGPEKDVESNINLALSRYVDYSVGRAHTTGKQVAKKKMEKKIAEAESVEEVEEIKESYKEARPKRGVEPKKPEPASTPEKRKRNKKETETPPKRVRKEVDPKIDKLEEKNAKLESKVAKLQDKNKQLQLEMKVLQAQKDHPAQPNAEKQEKWKKQKREFQQEIKKLETIITDLCIQIAGFEGEKRGEERGRGL